MVAYPGHSRPWSRVGCLCPCSMCCARDRTLADPSDDTSYVGSSSKESALRADLPPRLALRARPRAAGTAAGTGRCELRAGRRVAFRSMERGLPSHMRSCARTTVLRVGIAVSAVLVLLFVSGCGGAAEDAATTDAADDTGTVNEKPFLDGYDGQTLDELLAMTDTHRVDSVILAIEQALQQKAPVDLSAPERVVLAVEALEREVNNGGYNQFFLNEPSYAHKIVAALNEIDCREAARITEEAVAVLGLSPGWTDEQISAAAADMPDDQMAKLDPLDEQFFAYPDPIADRLLAFIRANSAAIRF